jgi:hypothetical protein
MTSIISTSTGTAGAVTPTLDGGAASLLTSGQQQFDAQLAADTGLDPNVIEAWLLNEQSGSAATYYQNKNFNDWLNIGITGSGNYGATDSIWSNPVTAANATAQWIEGNPNAVPGWKRTTPLSGILNSAKQGAQAQVSAIQHSGWASGGETAIPSLLAEITGRGGVTANATAYAPATVAQTGAGTAATTGGSASSSTSTSTSKASLEPGGYVQPSGGLFSSLDPFNAIVGVWDGLLGDAKYAGLFILILAVAGFLLVKGISSAGGPRVQIPTVIPVPA